MFQPDVSTDINNFEYIHTYIHTHVSIHMKY